LKKVFTGSPYYAALLNLVISFVLSLILPWWIIAVVAFLISLIIPVPPFKAFLAAFTAIFVLWAVQALIIYQGPAENFAKKVGTLFTAGAPYLIVIISGITGALVAGLSAASGALIKRLKL
jgi:hypothetical protein